MPKIFKVGGCVRDRLLGIESNDIDFTFVLDDVSGTPEVGFKFMTKYLKSEGYEIFLSTPDMFTIRAKFPKSHKNAGLTADFVLARKEIGYKEGTREPILVLGTLEDDLMRRDFTLNAMAEDEDGNLIDLFDGEKHLKLGVLYTPKDPEVTFMDDPLRILRALRFSITRGFTIHLNVWLAMFQEGIIKKLSRVVSIERTREELKKMFEHDSIATIRLLARVDAKDPSFLEAAFGDKIWLIPTLKKKKNADNNTRRTS